MFVGLDLAFNGVNYGMLLQAYATQVVFDAMGVDTEIIDYKRTDKKGVRLTPYLTFFFFDKFKNRVISHRRCSPNKEQLSDFQKKNIMLRKEVANEFRLCRLHDVVECNGYENLCQIGKKYDAVVVGSDQLWLPEASFGVFRTLRFVPDNVRKISYATSLGVSQYPFWCKSSAKQFLDRFDYISVREDQGKKIVTSLIEKEVEVVVDPTYLLTCDEWKKLIPQEKNQYGNYVLCYFLGSDKKARDIAIDYARKNGCRLVSILSNECFLKDDEKFGEVLIGKTPEEFVNLIRNASCVFTDSFHGMAFSIINKKDFFIFYRKRDGVASRGSRIDNALKNWGLDKRLILNGDERELTNNNHIDYSEVNVRIAEKREMSLNYIRRSIGGQ